MEKTCAAEKNRTTDNKWVEKKAKTGGNTLDTAQPCHLLKPN